MEKWNVGWMYLVQPSIIPSFQKFEELKNEFES